MCLYASLLQAIIAEAVVCLFISGCYIHIGVGYLRCSFFCNRTMREASMGGTGDKMVPTLFYSGRNTVIHLPDEGTST